MVPRLFSIPASEFNGERLRHFVRYVFETPPKVAGQPPKPRRPIEQMTEDQLRKRKKTLKTLISILRCALRMAWENARFDSDRAWRCLRNVPNVDRPRILHLSRPECQRLLACCAPDLKSLVLAALYTGCRITELLRLRAEDVSLDNPHVYVRPIKTCRERYVMLPDEGVTFFRELARNRAPDAPLLVRDSGLGWKGTHKYSFKLALDAAGLLKAFSFHSLRHTYASQLVGAGAPLIVVSEQLGHACINTVSRTYSHLSLTHRLAEVQSRFESLV